MANAVAVIGLTYDGTDVQDSAFGIFLELIHGLNEVPSVRGVDLIVPARAYRFVRNRVADVTRIELRGIVTGIAAPVTAAETVGGANTTLSADTAAGATSIVVADATGIAVGDYLRIGDSGETEIRQVDAAYVAGTTIPLTVALVWAHDSGDVVREVDGPGSSGDLANFRTNMKALRTLFDPTREPADLVASLEDGTTATISARPLNIVADQPFTSIASVSIELEGLSDWAIA